MHDDEAYQQRRKAFHWSLESSPSTMAPSKLLVATALTATAAVAYAYCVQKKAEAKTETKICTTKADVASELCAYIAAKANEAIAKRGVFHLAVAGGSLLDLLAGLKDHKVDYSKVVLSFANHKCVSPSDEKATLSKAKAKFADAIGITKFVVPMGNPPTSSDGTVEAEFYSMALKDAGVPHSIISGRPVMDLILLGLGADGHVGSNHPMGPAVANTKSAVAGSPKSGEPSSITFTIETINSARQIALVVCGGSKGKKEAVKRALVRPAEQPRGTFPAQLLKKPLYFLDSEAAADL